MAVAPEGFAAFAERMRAEALPEIVIQTFAHYYKQLRQGQTGLVPESEVEPVTNLPDTAVFSAELADVGCAALAHTVLLKLNGGLGTGMGLERAKSLLVVKEGLTFLDVIAHQALSSHVPLVLMNSYNTRDDSLAVLRNYPALWGQIPLDFVQHKVPKVLQADLSPVVWPANPSLEWCPPGHGDIYTALVTSGMLDTLLDAGYEYAFVSNSDNLGAVLDPTILGYFASRRLPFMMEVTDRTEADRKGGPLVRTANGRYMLWESALCPPGDMAAFQDISRYRYFNTNNLWLNLVALKSELIAHNYILGLPMIRSAKTVDPRDSRSPAAYQLETAMGAAIGLFEGATAVRVPRTRFAPVKTTDDLLAVRSDAYVLTGEYRIEANPARMLGTPVVVLDPRFYRLIDAMEARFPAGPPSLLKCVKLSVQGDFKFGRNVVLRGVVELSNAGSQQLEIEDNRLIVGVEQAQP
jgi:UTP--glucose-1-phosphate uridylyltransferase